MTSLSQMQDIDQIHVVQSEASQSVPIYGGAAPLADRPSPARQRTMPDGLDDPEEKYKAKRKGGAGWLSQFLPQFLPQGSGAMLPVTRRCGSRRLLTSTDSSILNSEVSDVHNVPGQAHARLPTTGSLVWRRAHRGCDKPVRLSMYVHHASNMRVQHG